MDERSVRIRSLDFARDERDKHTSMNPFVPSAVEARAASAGVRYHG